MSQVLAGVGRPSHGAFRVPATDLFHKVVHAGLAFTCGRVVPLGVTTIVSTFVV